MGENELLFEIGDWVWIPHRNNAIGFITTISEINGNCRIRTQFEGKENHLWIDLDKLYECKELALEKEDFDEIIHLALHYGDQQWFDDLHERIPIVLKDIFFNQKLTRS
ncbi:hypothetical protein [Bacillus sp. mrc49]|uniref:hypothetical protein n=1 Tax=Bacillus sp. mrc49 TaxID=2054913 RepID=UPI000C278959|nr:hypothetical protein [Bacillus sp. mrc49]PJN91022.1 hypothetical protein CVN76_07480 [Bacillus sp. mrc49]